MPARTDISAVIIAQDEADRIGSAIASAASVAADVVVVDGGSADNTVAIAERLGCTVIQNPWPGYAKQRAVGVAHSLGTWVLMIDADELVTPELASVILDVEDDPEVDGYELIRVGDFLGRWMSPERQLRLVRTAACEFPEVLVHERPDLAPERIRLVSDGRLLHYGFRSLNDHVRRFTVYTELDAEQMRRDGRRFSAGRLTVRPPLRFVQHYVTKGLYREGVPGFSVAMFWVMYEFLRELRLFEDEWVRSGRPHRSIGKRRGST